MNGKDIGLLIMRVGIGLLFMRHGYDKFMGGTEQWLWLGNQMALFGIRLYPTLWGLLAATSELLGGTLLVLGLGTRIAAIFISCVMIVALAMHFNKGDSFNVYSQAVALLVVLIGLFFTGSGRFSIDGMMK